MTKHHSMSQLFRFLVVGLSNTLVGYVSYVLFIWTLRLFTLEYDYIYANVFAFVVSTCWAFVFNKIYVFKSANKSNLIRSELLKSYITYGFSCLVLNNLLLFWFVDLCMISKYLAPFLNLLFMVPFNFLVNLYWVFKNNEQ